MGFLSFLTFCAMSKFFSVWFLENLQTKSESNKKILGYKDIKMINRRGLFLLSSIFCFISTIMTLSYYSSNVRYEIANSLLIILSILFFADMLVSILTLHHCSKNLSDRKNKIYVKYLRASYILCASSLTLCLAVWLSISV